MGKLWSVLSTSHFLAANQQLLILVSQMEEAEILHLWSVPHCVQEYLVSLSGVECFDEIWVLV